MYIFVYPPKQWEKSVTFCKRSKTKMPILFFFFMPILFLFQVAYKIIYNKISKLLLKVRIKMLKWNPLPFLSLQFQNWSFYPHPSFPLLQEFFRHHSHGPTSQQWGQNHDPQKTKTQLEWNKLNHFISS